MKTADFKKSVMALTIGLVMVSYGGGSNVAQVQLAATDTQEGSQTQKYEKLGTEISSQILSFQMRESNDLKLESKATVSTYGEITKPLKKYKFTGSTLSEIYKLVSQDIPQSKLIFSATQTEKQRKLLARFDGEIETVFSSETAKEIFQKLDSVSGLQTDISKVEIDTFTLKQIKESDNLKRIKNVYKSIKDNNVLKKVIDTKSTVSVQDNIIQVKGQVSSENWKSIIEKELKIPVRIDKSLENNWYQANNITIKRDFSSVDRQLTLFKEVGLIIEREFEPITVINIR